MWSDFRRRHSEMSGSDWRQLSSEAVFRLSLQRYLIWGDLKICASSVLFFFFPLLFLSTIFVQNSCLFSMKSIFEVAINGQGWCLSIFQKIWFSICSNDYQNIFFSSRRIPKSIGWIQAWQRFQVWGSPGCENYTSVKLEATSMWVMKASPFLAHGNYILLISFLTTVS